MGFSISIQQLSIVELVVAALFIFTALTQVIYYLVVFSKLAYFKNQPKNISEKQPVSVVISAHNEDYNLEKNLPSILTQDYPEFEVIVVNHTSTDDTKQLLSDLQRTHKHLKIVNIEQDLNFFKGKKFPLSIGIKSAKHEILLLTDADCKPASDKWIESMASNYTTKTDVVIGYGPYNKSKGFLNLLIRYDTFMIAMQYFSFALMGITYMGVGRNLSYRRSTFFKNKGFTSHYNISSGDDDLFIQQVSTNKNTKIEVSENSFMYSDAKPSFNSWFTQKQRHISTSNSYSILFKLLLGLFSISQLLFYVTFIILLFNLSLAIHAIILFIITLSLRVFIQKKAASKLAENQLLLFSLLGDIIYVMLMPIITFISLIRKTKSWK